MILEVVKANYRSLRKGYLRKVLTGEGLWPMRSWVKCCSVRTTKKLKIKNVTIGIITNLSSSMVWFKDKLGESRGHVTTRSNHTRMKEIHLEIVQVWDCTVEDDSNELICTTYTNKIHLLFSSLLLKNSTVKRVWLEVIMRWVTFWKIF